MTTLDVSVRMAAVLLGVFPRVGLVGSIPSVFHARIDDAGRLGTYGGCALKVFYEWGWAVPSRRFHARYDVSGRLGTNGGCALKVVLRVGLGGSIPSVSRAV
jgi:hypothetical protein